MSDVPQVLPDYQGACLVNVVPELIKQVMGNTSAHWVPNDIATAKQIVLLVLDGLGWEQFKEHEQMFPTLSTFSGGPITAVAPTSTPTGLTSIVTSRPPAVHGVLGYRLNIPDQGILDVIGWKLNGEDAHDRVKPEEFQSQPAFAANDVPAVLEQRHLGKGFTDAMMQGAELVGYTTPSGLPLEVWRLAKAGQQFIYAYYGGIDAVAHMHGMGEHYDAELYTVDRLIRDLSAGLPQGCALVVTSDHGQVQVGNRVLDLDQEIMDMCWNYSGEGRFRWLHTQRDRADELAAVCRERVGEMAWVMTKQELSDQGWFGGPIAERYWDRLGDVALISSAPIAFRDPIHHGERNMVTRHGSVTSAEMLVPLLAKQF